MSLSPMRKYAGIVAPLTDECRFDRSHVRLIKSELKIGSQDQGDCKHRSAWPSLLIYSGFRPDHWSPDDRRVLQRIEVQEKSHSIDKRRAYFRLL